MAEGARLSDRELRLECLRLAVQCRRPNAPAETIVADAAVFRAYAATGKKAAANR